ncbi:MAG TPA: sulfite exporter TauE/SafE family protein, partial [Flavipsychrobacter sp.]|nr:sulfite exporter TauE/SafE family protein [Flavipsychrobacter sp.]
NALLMLLFAVTMLVAASSMIRKRKEELSTEKVSTNYFAIISKGAMVGILTGFIGAGGGFLIIPALVNFLKLPMKTAVGTSLLIIAANSLLGFVFSMSYTQISWSFISTIAAIAILGIIIGSLLVKKIDGKKLKPAFGYFVLMMGCYILLKELFF